MPTYSEKRQAESGENEEELYWHEQGKREERGEFGRELGIVCVWLDAMGQRLSHAFMNAYFKQSPSWANLYCSPEWGCWLKANYMLQIWPLVKTLLIWHGLDCGLGACLWASAPDSHACVSTNLRGNKTSACMMDAVRFVFVAAVKCKSPFTNTVPRYNFAVRVFCQRIPILYDLWFFILLLHYISEGNILIFIPQIIWKPQFIVTKIKHNQFIKYDTFFTDYFSSTSTSFNIKNASYMFMPQYNCPII